MIPGIVASGRRKLPNGRLARRALDFGPSGFWSLGVDAIGQPDEVGSRTGVRAGGLIVPAQLTSDGGNAFEPQNTGYVRIPEVAPLDSGGFTVVWDMQYFEILNQVLAEHGSDNRGWSVQTTDLTIASLAGGPRGCLSINIGTGNAPWATTIAVNDGIPHRVVLAVQATGAARIYVDGVDRTFKKNMTDIYVPTYNTTYIDVGSRSGSIGLSRPGKLANFALFNRALSPDEAIELSK